MSIWKKYKLVDLCLNVTSGGTPNTRKEEYYGGSIPWVRTQEVNFNRIYDTDIKITDETNTKDEKAQYIKEAFDGFERILGNLHEESYIYVQDVRAATYGYGGKTQEYRYHN